ncbi:unnamed protein product [Dovyalis caffra]|uniref:Uncharacterized protein n=1 Tax=Dovyalis caffra TaxID=77055 RepID=A0AAV1SPD8_9ROSI|nr:unnamed protein product [Dovyalis caffra]
MAAFTFALQVNGSIHKHSVSHNLDHLRTSLSSTFKPLIKELQKLPTKVDFSRTLIQSTSSRILDTLVDTMFRFVDQPLLSSQSNFAPVDETVEAVEVTCTEGEIPTDLQEGVYVRNGPNPLFGGLKSTVSIFGRSSHVWAEGEGMLHALHFKKKPDGEWTISYNNRYVESETFTIETQLNKPSFLPAIEGDSLAILSSLVLNTWRFGVPNKYLRNTSVFEHSGKLYAIAENHLPQEVDISTLESLEDWDVDGGWTRPFTSHPKRAPESRELVIMGIDAQKPYYVEGPARIGIMPRYGDADSVKWFEVEPNCTFHILNCFEDGDQEVVVRGCRALAAILPGPDWGQKKFDWFSKGFNFENYADGSTEDGYLFHRAYEWRLNLLTGEVKEKNLTGTDFSMDFPLVNGEFTGLKHKYGYAQVIDSVASSTSGIAKYGGVAKLYFHEQQSIQQTVIKQGEEKRDEQLIRVEYHNFAENIFCTGIAFVPKEGRVEEDDGWIITYVHNEENNVSQAYLIDAKRFGSEPTAIITLPRRVPYGFHGTFVSMPAQA